MILENANNNVGELIELAKKLNDKIPKTVNKMFKRVRAFIRGEVVDGSAKMVRPFQGDKGEAILECKHLERVQGTWKEIQWHQREEQMSGIREQGREDAKEVFTISHKHPNQYVMMDATLTTNCKQLLAKIQRENMEVFAWTGSERAVVPRFVMEHQLNIYPLAKPVVHKRRPMSPEGRLALKEKVFRWLKEGLIRKVQHPNGSPMRYQLNKKMELGKCGWITIALTKSVPGHVQIRMTEDDEEKTGFHTEERAYCFSHIPKKLKNSAATLKRMMEKVLADQRGRNMEIYLEEMVIKRKNESDLVQDVEETLRKLKKVNIKIDPVTSSFRVKEGRFLSCMAISTLTPRDWRLYLGKETIEDGLGMGIILVSPEERMHSYPICLKFNTFDYATDCEALLAGIAVSVSKGIKDLHVFIDSSRLVS
nr:hypothetical protein [Tanacetum cinerariifolium]